jgi:hypothetical protein
MLDFERHRRFLDLRDRRHRQRPLAALEDGK